MDTTGNDTCICNQFDHILNRKKYRKLLIAHNDKPWEIGFPRDRMLVGLFENVCSVYRYPLMYRILIWCYVSNAVH